MSQVKLQGNAGGSGSVTVAAPNTNSAFTATLPAATGDVMVSGNMPAFSAYASAAQTVTSNTDTKVTFDTEQFDTNNNFASSRFTPTVAGYYQVNTTIRFNGTVPSQYVIYFYKNGSNLLIPYIANANLGTNVISVSTLVSLNGSTDYMEVYANITATSPTLGSSAPNTNYFSGCLVRTA